MNAFWRVFAALLLIAAGAILCMLLFRAAVETGLWPPTGPEPEPATPPPSLGQLPVESGSMPIGRAGSLADPGPMPVAPGEPITPVEPVQPIEPAPPDPCPPVAASGFTTGTLVYAINQVRLYTRPDNESPSVAEFSRGQSLVVTPDLDGTTAITRCGTLWVLVQGPQGQIGWVLGAAVSIDPIPIDPIITPNPCPGGCATPVPICTPVCPTPTCVQPCPSPCTLPCS